MAQRKAKKETPKVNPELNGFNIVINPFGEIVSSYDLDKINDFLNRNVDDKKLRDRDDLKQKIGKKKPAVKKNKVKGDEEE